MKCYEVIDTNKVFNSDEIMVYYSDENILFDLDLDKVTPIKKNPFVTFYKTQNKYDTKTLKDFDKLIVLLKEDYNNIYSNGEDGIILSDNFTNGIYTSNNEKVDNLIKRIGNELIEYFYDRNDFPIRRYLNLETGEINIDGSYQCDVKVYKKDSVNLKKYNSWPTGYVYSLDMHSLDFEEFCWAFDVNQNIMDHLYECFLNSKEVDNLVHHRMVDLFSLYIILGGMPEVVSQYLSTKSVYDANIISEMLNKSYEKDISKYEEENKKLYIKDIYNLIPSELNNKNKRFILKNLNEYTKFNKFDASFIWLNKAGVTIPVFNANELAVPLELSKERTLFKLFHYDTGMLINMFSDASLQLKILNREQSINFGAIYENVVAKELYVHGFNKLFYYNNKKLGEVDFVIEDKNKIIPIEVKSGKDYNYHRALNNVMNSDFEIEKAYVLSNENVSNKGNIIYLPIYMIMFIKKEKTNNNTTIDRFEFDFSILR